METITRVGVIGCGLMGSGIAEVFARAGLEVVVGEVDSAALESGRQRIQKSLDRGIRSGKLSEDDRQEVMDRTTFTNDLDAFADRELVIEAITEIEHLKLDVVRSLDKIMTIPEAILASNTSSIPIMKLATATGRPEQVIGLHFFNPAPVLKLVEVVPSLVTSSDTVERAESFITGALDKTVIRAQDRAGFVVNALLIPYLLSAIRMVESGFAEATAIDQGMVLGCAHPIGPLKLADLIGLDTVKAVADSLYAEFKEQLYSPPSILLRMVDAGLLGRKSGRGFYQY
ncbi:MAG: 3-hydroxybutyryl-CoA dehydrogenase [Euzebya sp.]